MDPVIGSAVIALIQVVAELGKQAGMTQEEINQHFLSSWSKLQEQPPEELPDAEAPAE